MKNMHLFAAVAVAGMLTASATFEQTGIEADDTAMRDLANWRALHLMSQTRSRFQQITHYGSCKTSSLRRTSRAMVAMRFAT